ncbi:WD40 repeat-like protein [Rickenella mellea]|uniref:WD40 repeat-like protein n=1 Tax=Rickenella mellea TaxID=50990 RepID=A0A4Y7QCK6_9AGAM|nr:WD40 repeat-like protein [Rickenella mellea]
MATPSSLAVFKTPLKRAYGYDENAFASKKRRSSFSALTLDVVRHDLPPRSLTPGPECAEDYKGDRFIKDPWDRGLPFRTKFSAEQFALTVNNLENQIILPPSPKTRKSHLQSGLRPFRKHLTKDLYELPPPPSATSATTNLRHYPEMTLDAPGLCDDYYARPLAWSSTDCLAVLTRYSVNYRDMNTGRIKIVCMLEIGDIGKCILWAPDTNVIGVGYDSGAVQLYNADGRMTGVVGRDAGPYVGGMSWASRNVLSVGYGDGCVRQYDTREKHATQTVEAHKSRVCGIKWSPDGSFLATGANDGSLMIWDARAARSLASDGTKEHERSMVEKKWKSRKHRSTTKAIAWCPWQPNLLATGGGAKDGFLRTWSAASATPLYEMYSHSQISSLHFAPNAKELVSTHGYRLTTGVEQSVVVRSYPKFEQTGKIFDAGHGRIIDSCLSPDGTRLVTAGADETIRVYRLFGAAKVIGKEESEMRHQSVIR